MTKEELEKEADEYSEDTRFIDYSNYSLSENINISDEIKEAYLAGAESREKRITELIALINAERKRQEKCDDVHLQRIAELEKENAKLKAQLESERDLPAITYMQGAEKQKKKDEEQLTKAKEIIKKFLLWENDWHDKTESKYELLEQAEQFLKECK